MGSPDATLEGVIRSRLYVPVLKDKQGERLALREVDPATRAMMTPLLQLWPGSSPGDVEKHISELGKHIGAYGPIMVDSGWIDAAAAWPRHPLVVASDAAAKSGLTVIPVADVDGTAADTRAAKEVAAAHGAGAALRMASVLWNSPKTSIPLAAKCAAGLGLKVEQIDLLVDAARSRHPPRPPWRALFGHI